MSCFTRDRDVWFVEEPLRDDGPISLLPDVRGDRLTVCQPRTPIDRPGFHPEQMRLLAPLVADVVGTRARRPLAAWLYTPLALPLARALRPDVIVYDCMDELSAFLHAPPELLACERELLRRADVVFAGGPSLYRAKRRHHPHAHCFPSSVDAAHFGTARRIEEAADQRAIAHPRLGFYGVIDERLDRELLARMAARHPEWQIVLVGPVVKIDPADLPRAANLHYLGARPYAELPAYLAGWDVCLMPFARNEATRFISPTKTLEYMAAEKPIVSTTIEDVVDLYGGVVRIGDGDDFIAACAAALQTQPEQRRETRQRMRALVEGTSWRATADSMLAIADQLVAPPAQAPRRALQAEVQP